MVRDDEMRQLIMQDPDVDIISVLQELITWEDSLCGDMFDNTVAHTLESVIDIIIDNIKE